MYVTLSDQAWPSSYLSPDDRVKVDLEDYEYGPIAVSDPSAGLLYQIWKLHYDKDQFKFFLTENDGAGATQEITDLDGIQEVTEVGLAFDQNGFLFIVYVVADVVSYYWYDATLPGYTTDTLEAGAKSPRCCLDDKRPLELADSDILLTYIFSGQLMIRYQRDRFATPNVLASNIGVGRLNRFGMARNLRVQWDGGINSVYLADIVRQLCWISGVTEVNTNDISEIKVRGFMMAGIYTSADAIRSLMRCYFFDMPLIDGELVCKLRGGPVVATITLDDMVHGEEVDFEDARQQEVEFAKKLHVKYSPTESDYTPTKQTSDRFSNTIDVEMEVNVEVPVNFTPDDAKKCAVVLHKILWNEMEGTAKFTTTEKFAYLTPSDPILVEVEPNEYKRIRIEDMFLDSLSLEITGKIDRVSAYDSSYVGEAAPIPKPEPPPANIPSQTTWEFMNLPALISSHDTLHAYVSGYGTNEAWTGAELQRLDGTNWITEGQIISNEPLGVISEALPAHPKGIDTTNNVLVTMGNGTLQTITQQEFDDGGNPIVIGDEILQYRDASPEGTNLYRISYLNRGEFNTDPVAHSPDTRLVALSAPVRLFLDTSLIGQTFDMRAVTYGTDGLNAVVKSVTFTGESQREWEPLSFTGALVEDDWVFSWAPNPRIGYPANPVESVNFSGYRVKLGGPTAYNPNLMNYQGGYYSAAVTTSGNKVTVVGRFSRDEFTGNVFERIFEITGPGGFIRFGMNIFSSDYLDTNRTNRIIAQVRDNAGTTIARLFTPVGFVDGKEHIWHFYFDGDTGASHFIIDELNVDDASNPDRIAPVAGTLDSGLGAVTVGALAAGTAIYSGNLGYLGYKDAALTNYADFMTGNKPKQLDEATWTEWGGQPGIWNSAGDMEANLGTFGNLTKTGTIASVPGQAADVVTIDLPPTQTTLTYTDIEQIADFGGLVATWVSVEVVGLNRLTDEGKAATL